MSACHKGCLANFLPSIAANTTFFFLIQIQQRDHRHVPAIISDPKASERSTILTSRHPMKRADVFTQSLRSRKICLNGVSFING